MCFAKYSLESKACERSFKMKSKMCFEVQFEVEINVQSEGVWTEAKSDTYSYPSKGGFDLHKDSPSAQYGFVTRNATTAAFTGQKNGGFSTACTPPDRNIFDMDHVCVTSLPALTYIPYLIPILWQINFLSFIQSLFTNSGRLPGELLGP